jgi:Glutamine cyclotransferase
MSGGADVLNGISVSDQEDVLYVTGKNWDRMFKVRYVATIDRDQETHLADFHLKSLLF